MDKVIQNHESQRGSERLQAETHTLPTALDSTLPQDYAQTQTKPCPNIWALGDMLPSCLARQLYQLGHSALHIAFLP